MPDQLPPMPPLTDDSVETLLELSRGIQLDTLQGYGIKLSKFTQKQLSRANPIKNGYKRSGLQLRKVNKKIAWQTKRKKKRDYNRTARQMYHRLANRYGSRWQVTPEVWLDEVAPYVERYRVKVEVYDSKAPVTVENLWIQDSRTGAKLWEGAEERLRALGYTL